MNLKLLDVNLELACLDTILRSRKVPHQTCREFFLTQRPTAIAVGVTWSAIKGRKYRLVMISTDNLILEQRLKCTRVCFLQPWNSIYVKKKVFFTAWRNFYSKSNGRVMDNSLRASTLSRSIFENSNDVRSNSD